MKMNKVFYFYFFWEWNITLNILEIFFVENKQKKINILDILFDKLCISFPRINVNFLCHDNMSGLVYNTYFKYLFNEGIIFILNLFWCIVFRVYFEKL